MSSETQMNEKMHALVRMTKFVKAERPTPFRFAPQILIADDAFSQMLRIMSDLLRFCILCLTHRREIVKMSALKTIKFVLETQGCSLDFAMVFILKGMLQTYPIQMTDKQQEENKQQIENIYQSFELQKFSSLRPTLTPEAEQSSLEATPFESHAEPNSGFKQTLCNVYSHVLDTYISVLSSISSHILHSIFYEVIEPTLTNQICLS